MRRVFADTFYWLAKVNPSDQWHKHVSAAAQALSPLQLFTTDEVLAEFLSGLSGRGDRLRQMGGSVVRGLLISNDTIVLPQSRATFLSGVELFETRNDKAYSLIDCISMCAMRQHGLTDVLSNDTHFIQEGFNILLR